jgi:invasion protein IalB
VRVADLHPGARSALAALGVAFAFASPFAFAAPFASAMTPSGPGVAVPGARPVVLREERFASWGLVCEVAADPTGRGSERCSISQAVSLDPGRTKVVLGVVADYLDSPDVLTLRFRLAPTAERRAGIGLKVDDRPEMRLPLDDCNAQRCEAAGRLRGEALKRWREGKAVQLAFIDTSSGRQVLLPIALYGFVSALNALTRLHRRSVDRRR